MPWPLKVVDSFECRGPVRRPVQLLGAVNPYCALMAEKLGESVRRAGARSLPRIWFAGAKAIYLSGSGVATASYGLPDLGITCLEDVLVDVRRITRQVCVRLCLLQCL